MPPVCRRSGRSGSNSVFDHAVSQTTVAMTETLTHTLPSCHTHLLLGQLFAAGV